MLHDFSSLFLFVLTFWHELKPIFSVYFEYFNVNRSQLEIVFFHQYIYICFGRMENNMEKIIHFWEYIYKYINTFLDRYTFFLILFYFNYTSYWWLSVQSQIQHKISALRKLYPEFQGSEEQVHQGHGPFGTYFNQALNREFIRNSIHHHSYIILLL